MNIFKPGTCTAARQRKGRLRHVICHILHRRKPRAHVESNIDVNAPLNLVDKHNLVGACAVSVCPCEGRRQLPN